MFKKVISVIVGIACLFSVTGVFAAVQYNGAATSYLGGEAIQVTSQITSGKAGDVTTYLVHDEGVELVDVGSEDIVYVDQHTAASDGEVHKFIYKANKSDIGANISIGGAIDTPGTVKGVIPGYVYITDKNDIGKVYYNSAPIVSGDGNYVLLQYGEGVGASIPAAFVAGINDGGLGLDVFLASNGVYISKADLENIEEGLTFSVELSEAVADVKIDTLRWFDEEDSEVEDVEDGDKEASIVATGTVLGANVKEYGILIADDLESYRALRDNFNSNSGEFDLNGSKTIPGAQALPALAKNAEGKFGIRVYSNLDFAASAIDETGKPVNVEVYVIAYAVEENSDGSFSLLYPDEGLCLHRQDDLTVQAVVLNFDDFIIEDEEIIIYDDPYGENLVDFEE